MPRKRVIKRGDISREGTRDKLNLFVQGRLGNSIFRYIKAVLLISEYKHLEFDCSTNIYNFVNENNLNLLKIKNKNYTLRDYFQHEVSESDKKKVIEYIKSHPNHYLITDGNNASLSRSYHYNSQKYFLKDLIFPPKDFNKFYDLVIHVRLEDFVELGNYIKVGYLCKVLDMVKENGDISFSAGAQKVAIVCNKISTKFEKDYLEELKDYYKKLFGTRTFTSDITIESNSLIEDFHIIKNSKIVVSSTSTICWSACIFSEKLEKCYFPNWDKSMRGFGHNSVSFRKPIKNTILYDIK